MAIMGHLTVLLEWVHQRLTAIFLQFVEKNLVPDWLLRFAVRYLLTKHLADRTAVGEEYQEKLEAFVDELKGMPIAIETDAANEQHYELPTEYFERCLGKHKKYSSCLWADQNTTLDEAEESMLALYCERAQLSDGQDVLELGCGWGSLCMFVAARYPKSRVTAVSNSKTQREYINAQCANRGIKNLTVITANLVHFQPPKTADGVIAFDRVVSVECLEHMKNYQELLKRIASWMKPGGLLFVHIFVENALPSHFTMDNPDDWMARYFFSGGTMPSADLLLHFQDDLAIQKQWYINGSHYSRTLEAWLDRMDAQKTEIMPIFKATYGKDAVKWWVYWRLFYIACSEQFAFHKGNQAGVGHYLFKKRS